MPQPKLYDFAGQFVTALGELVEKWKQIGLANGLREEEIKDAILTTFDVLAKKHRISQQLVSQNLRRKRATP